MKAIAYAALAAVIGTGAWAEPVQYDLDPSHSQVIFSYKHLGFSTTFGMFSGFEGEILFDEGAPENSSVNVSMPISSMFTGWEAREAHFLGGQEFFDAAKNDLVSFASTGIEVTGDSTAVITGDLTMNGITKSVALDAVLNQKGQNPLAQKEWIGFDATTTLLRSDFGVGAFAPNVSDEVEVRISVEAGAAG